MPSTLPRASAPASTKEKRIQPTAATRAARTQTIFLKVLSSFVIFSLLCLSFFIVCAEERVSKHSLTHGPISHK